METIVRRLWLACACLILMAPAASGATWMANSLVDTNDGVCAAQCSLREAIDVAATGDSIIFPSPFPVPFPSPLTITLVHGPLMIDKDLTIWGPGPAWLTIDANGGLYAFHVDLGTTVTLIGLTITGAADSPSAFGSGIRSQGHLTVQGCTITGNSLGISNQYDVLLVDSSTISENSGVNSAGGITNQGDLTIQNSTIANNTSDDHSIEGGGGGISSGRPDSQGTLTIINSTISGNVQLGTLGYPGGGGIWTSSETTITHTTITNNSAGAVDSAGGILVADDAARGVTVRVRNSIVAANVRTRWNPDVAIHLTMPGAIASQGYNLIGDRGAVTAFFAPGDQTGTSPDLDPMLDPLDNYGGATETHRLQVTSPAVDAGVSFGSTTDQRGFLRPYDRSGTPNAPGGDGSDIGAYEVQFAVAVTGLVFGGGDRPVPDVHVVLVQPNGQRHATRTDRLGRFRFDGVRPYRTYRVEAKYRNHEWEPQVIRVTEAGINDLRFAR